MIGVWLEKDSENEILPFLKTTLQTSEDDETTLKTSEEVKMIKVLFYHVASCVDIFKAFLSER
jgi:hypothetical protein